MPTKLTIAEVDALLEVAERRGVLELSFRGLTVRRMPDTTPARLQQKTSEIEALEKMPADSVDARLQLRRMKGGG